VVLVRHEAVGAEKVEEGVRVEQALALLHHLGERRRVQRVAALRAEPFGLVVEFQKERRDLVGRAPRVEAAAERGKSKETAVSIATAPALRRFNMPNPSKLQDNFHV
jgi:hypothetical protein